MKEDSLVPPLFSTFSHLRGRCKGLVLLFAPDVTNKVAVGSAAGAADVTNDGQAHYRVPLWVAPGRAGMEPELALEYTSRSPSRQ